VVIDLGYIEGRKRGGLCVGVRPNHHRDDSTDIAQGPGTTKSFHIKAISVRRSSTRPLSFSISRLTAKRRLHRGQAADP
jgi:hypothetical protein